MFYMKIHGSLNIPASTYINLRATSTVRRAHKEIQTHAVVSSHLSYEPSDMEKGHSQLSPAIRRFFTVACRPRSRKGNKEYGILFHFGGARAWLLLLVLEAASQPLCPVELWEFQMSSLGK